MLSLAGKRVIVTGAAGLLGRSQILSLSSKGAKVIGIDSDPVKLSQLASEQIASIETGDLVLKVCDITSRVSVESLLAELEPFGPIHGLVNNAAINPKVEDGLPRKNDIELFDWNQWELELKVALFGTYLCSQVFGTHMLKHGLPSSIVNLSSDYGHLAPRQSLYDDGSPNPPIKPPMYVAVKHSIVGVTRYFASFWAGGNIRVNSLAPGGIANGQDEVFTIRLSNEVPVGRMARVEEMNGPIAFLLSDESSYVNGVELIADGGRAIW